MYREVILPELCKIAEENSVEVIDMFSKTYEHMLKTGEMFTEDGIHYSKKGHDVLAKIILEYLGYENVPDTFDIKNDFCSVINRLEQIERHIEILRQFFSENYISSEMKKHILNYIKSIDGAVELKKQVAIVKDIDECVKLLRCHIN